MSKKPTKEDLEKQVLFLNNLVAERDIQIQKYITIVKAKDGEMLKILKGIAMQMGLKGTGQPIDLIAEIYKLIGMSMSRATEMIHYKKIISDLIVGPTIDVIKMDGPPPGFPPMTNIKPGGNSPLKGS